MDQPGSPAQIYRGRERGQEKPSGAPQPRRGGPARPARDHGGRARAPSVGASRAGPRGTRGAGRGGGGGGRGRRGAGGRAGGRGALSPRPRAPRATSPTEPLTALRARNPALQSR